MDKLIQKNNKLVRVVHSIENWVLVLITAAIVVFSGLQILLRNLFESGIVWIPPLLGTLVIWVGLLGALIATRNNAHIKINVLTTYLSDHYKPFAFTISHLFSAIVLFIFFYYSIEFVKLDLDTETKAFANVPVWLVQVVLPATCLLMAVRYTIYTMINIIEVAKRFF